jgi:hypothetical protein
MYTGSCGAHNRRVIICNDEYEAERFLITTCTCNGQGGGIVTYDYFSTRLLCKF